MKINSPVANIVETIQQVNQTAVKYGAKLKTNEAATRAALIDPILKAMGWDVSNPELVELEKNYGNTKLDYGLMDANGKVCIIVEAKALGANLNGPNITAQVFNYGFAYGIQNIILTDGNIWQHFQQVTPGNITPEWIDLSRNDLVTCADFFMSKLDACRFHFNAPVVPPPPPSPQPQPGKSSSQNTAKFTPLSALPADLHGQKPPKSMCLPDGNVISVQFWKDILTECVKFVLNENSTIPIPLPDKAGKKTSLLSNVKPAAGISSIQTTYNGNTIFIHINYDVNNCVANAKYILGFLPKGKTWQSVEIEF